MANTTIEKDAPSSPPAASKLTWRPTDSFIILGLLLLIFGASGMYQRLVYGLAPTNLTSYVPWGLWVGFYDYLVWLEVGSLLVFSALIYLVGLTQLKRLKPVVLFTGFVVLSMALLVVLLDLGQATRFWHVLVYPTFSSMITWMVWAHILYLLVLVAELVLVYDILKVSPERKEQWLKLLAYVTLPLGLALIIISGSVFGVVAARPLWNTSSLPLMFLISAVAAGSALLLLLTVLFWPSKNERDYVHLISILSRLTAWMLLAGIFSASVIGFTTLYGGSPARTAAMQLILTGPFWWSFWIVHVLLGVFIPILIFFLRGDNPTWAGIGAFLATITFVAVTLNIVIPVLVTPEIQGLATAFVHPKLSLDYTPNLMEWQTILFIFGFGSLLFGLGWRILPIDQKMRIE